MRLLGVLVFCAVGVATLDGQEPEITGAVGFGRAFGEADKGGGANIGSVGAGLGLWAERRHRLQVDYAFANYTGTAFDNHFLTGSWMLQKTQGAARPYLQAGAGIALERSSFLTAQGSDRELRRVRSTDTDLAVLFGFGVSVNLGRSLVLRPQVRFYGTAGPTTSVIAAIAIGWRPRR